MKKILVIEDPHCWDCGEVVAFENLHEGEEVGCPVCGTVHVVEKHSDSYQGGMFFIGVLVEKSVSDSKRKPE